MKLLIYWAKVQNMISVWYHPATSNTCLQAAEASQMRSIFARYFSESPLSWGWVGEWVFSNLVDSVKFIPLLKRFLEKR